MLSYKVLKERYETLKKMYNKLFEENEKLRKEISEVKHGRIIKKANK